MSEELSRNLKLKSILEAKLNELLNRAAEIEAELNSQGDSDWTENAIEAENDEILEGIESVTQQEIREIRLSLNRIESGTFGTCSDCGKVISEQRLEAIPFCNTCINCA